MFNGINSGQWKALAPGLFTYLQKYRPDGKPYCAIVSGASITGLICALRLAKQGFKVDVYERRTSYTRNIQWGARQSLIDTLAKIDPQLAAIFLIDVAAPLPGGSRFVAEISTLYEHGAYWNKRRPLPQPGDPMASVLRGPEMLERKTVCAFAARRFEAFLFDYIKRVPLVDTHAEPCAEVIYDEANGRYRTAKTDSIDLIVVAEGAGSETRSSVGIRTFPTSRATRQVAGSVFMKRSGIMIKHLNVETTASGEEEFLLSGLISAGLEPTSWIVGDLADEVSDRLDGATSRSRRQDILKVAFTQLASRCMLNSEENIAEAKFEGAVLEKDVQDFFLASNLSTTAVAGENLVLVGDAVGNGHWSVGGGMQIGAVLHSARIDALSAAIAAGESRTEALKTYNQDVRDDTKAWIREGIADFYIGVPPKLVVASLDKALAAKDADRAIDALETMHEAILAGLFPARLYRSTSDVRRPW